MDGRARYWALIPAAGVGRRMGTERPKQYLELLGRSVLEHTLSRFLDHPAIFGVCVVIGAADPYWQRLAIAADPRIRIADGGIERCHSVRNGLDRIVAEGGLDDWVLVHDAARPCLDRGDIDRLIAAAGSDGAILGAPVRDTMKRAAADGTIEATVPREGLWHAFTPQLFPVERLRRALGDALRTGRVVTDEASAIELAGGRPRLIEGRADNVKITRPEDLELARLFLARYEPPGRLE